MRLWESITGSRCPVPIEVTGCEPVLPGPFLIGTAAGACVAVTTAAARVLRGDTTPVRVDLPRAAASFGSERGLRVDGEPPGSVWAELSGVYRGRDGWIRLHCNYPHHAAAVVRALGVDDSRDAVAAAVARRDVLDVQEAVHAEGGAAAALRTPQEWATSAQGRAVATEPLAAIDRIGPATPEPAPEGFRVAELTHVIAGPTCGKILAAHGADVLHIGAEHLPRLDFLHLDTAIGKRSTFLDVSTSHGAARLRELVRGADVFLQSFRPGSLAARGFGTADLASARPGIVYVELDAYGWSGPLAGRRGFDSLIQLATGIAAHGGTDEVRSLPVQALDHATGWLAAFGTLHALRRRAVEGGSWRVRLSLARTALWLDSLGRKYSAGEESYEPYLSEIVTDGKRVGFVPIPHARVGPAAPPLPGGDAAVWRT
jgi:crotonobetainyl-CoA:carnitine CoA-transferase CaiB-like acyl-CoA transferase